MEEVYTERQIRKAIDLSSLTKKKGEFRRGMEFALIEVLEILGLNKNPQKKEEPLSEEQNEVKDWKRRYAKARYEVRKLERKISELLNTQDTDSKNKEAD